MKFACNLNDDYRCRLFINNHTIEFLINPVDHNVEMKYESISRDSMYDLISSTLELPKSGELHIVESKYFSLIEICYTYGIGLEVRSISYENYPDLIYRLNKLFGKC